MLSFNIDLIIVEASVKMEQHQVILEQAMKIFVRSISSKVLGLVLSLGIASCHPPGADVSVPDVVTPPGADVPVPDVVLQAFNTTYPNVSPQWQRRHYGYEAVFVKDGVEYEVEYSFTGEWLETEYEVQELQFPQAVLETVRRQYPGYTITKYEIELTPLGTFYEVEVERGGTERELYFDGQGRRVANFNEDA